MLIALGEEAESIVLVAFLHAVEVVALVPCLHHGDTAVDAVVEGETSRIGSGGPERGSVGETVSRLINRLSLKSRREEHRGRGQKSKGERLMINIHSCVALEWMKPQSRWSSCWYPVGYTVP